MDEPRVHLFSAAGLAALRGFAGPSTLVAFDLDGTLAPIVADPARIRIPDELRRGLARLCALAPVAVITGRGCRDARAHLGFTPRFLVGNHGAEGLPGWEPREAEFVRLSLGWERRLRQLLPDAARRGIVLENKGASVALHYRRALDREAARAALLELLPLLEPAPRWSSGRCVLNLVPRQAPHKGTALLALMELAACQRALFVGDDETDEDVFRQADERILGVHVGALTPSAARFHLGSQDEVAPLVAELVTALEGRGASPGRDEPSQRGS